MTTIGAIVIGQSPRADLVGPLNQMRPDLQIIQAGALDELTIAELPDPITAYYPLMTRMRDGKQVRADEAFLAPLLQSALFRLEAQGVVASILLCAGSFQALQGNRPLIKPFETAWATLRALGMKHLGVVCPTKSQEIPIKARWQAAGFEPVVYTTPLAGSQTDLSGFDSLNTPLACIVLDYVGHPPEQVEALQQITPLPVLDMGQLALSLLTSIV